MYIYIYKEQLQCFSNYAVHYATVYKRPNATVFGRLIDLAHELDQTYVSFPKRRSKSIKLLNDKYPPDIESSFWGRGYVVEG